jgi:hypothetical protein
MILEHWSENAYANIDFVDEHHYITRKSKRDDPPVYLAYKGTFFHGSFLWELTPDLKIDSSLVEACRTCIRRQSNFLLCS